MNSRQADFLSRFRPFVLLGTACLLFVLVFALFAPSIRYGFIDFDDPAYIVGNALVLPGISLESIKGAFAAPSSDLGMYMPLLWISYMADVTFFGGSPTNPAPFHATNVALHAANAVLFFLLLVRLLPERTPGTFRHLLCPFLLALLWAVHPLRVESVAWITERKDVLSLFFAFLSLLAYLRANPCLGESAAVSSPPVPPGPEAPQKKSSVVFSIASFLFFAAALLVKPTLVPFPLILVFIDLLVLRRAFSLRLILSKTHFFLLSAAVALATLVGHGNPLRQQIPLMVRLGHVPQTLAHYVHLSILPHHLTLLDPRPAFALLPAILDVFLLAVLLCLACRLRRRAPAASLGIFWFFVFLLPVSGLAVIPNNTVADRFSYVPALGFSIALLGLAAPPSGGGPTSRFRRIICPVLIALCVLFSILSARTLPHWRSSETVYGRVRRFAPLNPFVALHDAKSAITASGDFRAAFDTAAASFAANPGSRQLVGLLATCIADLDGPLPAIAFLEAHPAAPGPLRGTWAWQMAHLSLRLRRNRDALEYAAIADESLPSMDTLHANIRRLREAASSPDSADALPHALSQWMTYHRADALESFRRLAEAYPSRPDFLANIAWILSTADWSPSPPSEPLGLATRALALAPDPPPPELLDTYAAALANASDFPAAATVEERAISLLPPSSPSLPDYRDRLDLYRHSLPYRKDIGIAW